MQNVWQRMGAGLYTWRWLIISIILSLASALILAHFDSTVTIVRIPVAGATLAVEHSQLRFPASALWTYSTTEASSTLTLVLTSARKLNAIAFIADANPRDCSIRDGAFTHSPRAYPVTRDLTASFDFDVETRIIYAISFRQDGTKPVFLTCNVTTLPEHETYATRAVAFLPATLSPKMWATSFRRFGPVYPEFIAFNVAGNADVSVGAPEAPGFVATLFGYYEVSPNHPMVRARWTDIQSSAHREFWLFFAAALAGVAAGTLIEFVRPYLERLRRQG